MSAGGGTGSNQFGPEHTGRRVPESEPARPDDEATRSDGARPAGAEHLVVQYGQTPFDEDARFDLMPRYQSLVTMDEVNAAEAENIAMARVWLRSHPFDLPEALLDQTALRDLHRRMFGNVWTWAGKLRVRETNVGIDPTMIAQEWELLLRNTIAQIEHRSYPAEEIGIRFHRAMLAIHCFTNGNGRHARMTANEIGRLLGLGDGFYTWGARSGDDPGAVRRSYLEALRLADVTDEHGPLQRLARS